MRTISTTTGEYKVMKVRECPPPTETGELVTPDAAATYWRSSIPAAQWFDQDKESLVVLLLNTRRRLLGHTLVSVGTLDTIQVHPREVFRPAIIAAASAIILIHNHPSGDPTPSEADIRVTRELIRAGQLLKIELLDHLIIGEARHTSLRELGYFYA